MNDKKKDLRKKLSKKRSELKNSIKITDETFSRIILKHDLLRNCNIIASFLSIKTEISTFHLNNFIQKLEKFLCLPVIDELNNGILIFKEYLNDDNLKVGKFGVKEPINSNTLLPDIIFTPCLAYDLEGFRLGYGGGYYDKTISYLNSIGHNFLTVGLAFDDQKVDSVIHNNLDQKLNYILTEKQLYKTL